MHSERESAKLSQVISHVSVELVSNISETAFISIKGIHDGFCSEYPPSTGVLYVI
jgi:hypothetical protein